MIAIDMADGPDRCVVVGYADRDGRLIPIVVDELAADVCIVSSRYFARLFGIAFGDTFVIGALDQLGAQMARNLAEALHPEAVR